MQKPRISLDVVVLSKGNYANKAKYLPLCLAAIKREVKYHRLIVVGNSLNEQTLNLIEKEGGEIYLENFNRLGKIRQYAISLVDCPFFLFVDDDCILRHNFMEILKYLREDVGGIEGLDYVMNPKQQLFNEALRGWAFGKNSLSKRAFTGDTLIRTSTVRDLIFPEQMTAYEDEYLKTHIETQKYQWVKASDRYYCNHFNWKGPVIGYYACSCAKKWGYLTNVQSIVNFIKIFPQVIYAVMKTGYWSLASYQIKFYFYCLIGTFCPEWKTAK